jgi:hypothetical protein
MKKKMYVKVRKEQAAEERKKSALFRYFFPSQANWEVKENPYTTRSKDEFFSTKTLTFPSKTNDFRDHLNY